MTQEHEPEFFLSRSRIFAMSIVGFVLWVSTASMAREYGCAGEFLYVYNACAWCMLLDNCLYAYRRGIFLLNLEIATDKLALTETYKKNEHGVFTFRFLSRAAFLCALVFKLPSTGECTHDASGGVRWPMMLTVVLASLHCAHVGALLVLRLGSSVFGQSLH